MGGLLVGWPTDLVCVVYVVCLLVCDECRVLMVLGRSGNSDALVDLLRWSFKLDELMFNVVMAMESLKARERETRLNLQL